MTSVLDPTINPAGRYEVSEAAAYLGISRFTLYKWARAGKIPCEFRAVDGQRIFKGTAIIRAFNETLKLDEGRTGRRKPTNS